MILQEFEVASMTKTSKGFVMVYIYGHKLAQVYDFVRHPAALPKTCLNYVLLCRLGDFGTMEISPQRGSEESFHEAFIKFYQASLYNVINPWSRGQRNITTYSSIIWLIVLFLIWTFHLK